MNSVNVLILTNIYVPNYNTGFATLTCCYQIRETNSPHAYEIPPQTFRIMARNSAYNIHTRGKYTAIYQRG